MTTNLSTDKSGLLHETLKHAMSYPQFVELVEKHFHQGFVTGPNQTAALLEATKLNLHRMRRIERTGRLPHEVNRIIIEVNEPLTWFVITEGWCGDSAQLLPYLALMAEANPLIELKIVLRDENDELMSQYLTEGTRSIPIFICLDEKGRELFHWGPRPLYAQQLHHSLRTSTEPVYQSTEIKKLIHTWYAEDKGVTFMNEWCRLLSNTLAIDRAPHP